MANQIASQFAHHPGDASVEEVASHLSSFWEPHMRGQLLALVDARTEGIDPVVIAVAERLRS